MQTSQPPSNPVSSTVETWRPGAWPRAERGDCWVEAVIATHLTWAFDLRDALLAEDAVVRRLRLGDAALIDCVAGAGSGTRARRQIAATDGEFVGVLQVRGGIERLELRGEPVELTPGDVVLWDSTVPVRFQVPARLVKRTFLVPKARLSTLVEPGTAGGSGRSGFSGRLPAGPATELFTSHLDAVARLGDALTPAAAQAAGAAAVELLAAALASDDDVPEPGPVGWEVVREIIEARLGDARLDPRAIAAAGALSLRALYTLFERRGETVAGYVRRRRLARAHADLLRLRSRTTVSATAARWGFADADSFARAYRRQFGHPPSRTLKG